MLQQLVEDIIKEVEVVVVEEQEKVSVQEWEEALEEQRVGDPQTCTWKMGECLAIQDWCPQASDIIPPIIMNPPPSQTGPNGKIKHLLHTDLDSDG